MTEQTFPGQCWRARDTDSQNHVTQYCATSAPEQHVAIKPQEEVALTFHFPRNSKLAEQATVRSLGGGAVAGAIVGQITQGHYLTARAHAGARFSVHAPKRGLRGTESLTVEVTATHEAEQLIHVGVTVDIIFSLRQSWGTPVSLYWVFGDDGAIAREHLHSTLQPGHSTTVHTSVGEQWLIRDDKSGKVLHSLVAAEAPKQMVALPPAPLPSARR